MKLLEKSGWELDRITGSHHVMKKGTGTVSIPIHAGKDLPKGTLNQILKDAGLK